MNRSSDNVVYLTKAAKESGVSIPKKGVGPLSDEKKKLVESYDRCSPEARAAIQRLMLRMLNRPIPSRKSE